MNSFVTHVPVANATTAGLKSGEFSFKKACRTTVPRLDGAFCGVNVTNRPFSLWRRAKGDLHVGKYSARNARPNGSKCNS